MTPSAPVAVIGGSGFYSFLDDARPESVTTPHGEPSSPVFLGTVGGREVAFVPRHGGHHEYPPHRINYRANLWALRSLGVRQVLAPVAVGGLRTDQEPGAVVVPDQLVDRTKQRGDSFVESGAVHVPFADPYCAGLRAAFADGEPDVVSGGTMVVIEGPRFSTRAESRSYAAAGYDLINMTGHPEAILARELRMCYAAIALITDLDAGIAEGEGVSQEEVFAAFGANIERLKGLIGRTIGRLPDPKGCACSTWADGIDLTYAVL